MVGTRSKTVGLYVFDRGTISQSRGSERAKRQHVRRNARYGSVDIHERRGTIVVGETDRRDSLVEISM